MKILIIGDSHGNITNLRHAVGFGKKIGVEAVIHCGDWDNTASFETVLSFGIPIYAVSGNADIDPLLKKELEVKSKKYNDEVLKINLGGKKIFVSHNISKLKEQPDRFDIGFYGHTHSQNEEEFGEIKLVRPGALEKTANFVVYDTGTNKVIFFNDQIE